MDGSQHREFREAVSLCQQSEIEKSVGPRATAWVLRFTVENGGTPSWRRPKFKADAGFGALDAGVVMHEHLRKFVADVVDG